MDIRYLETFLQICESRSYTLAAERLGLTQPGVSKQMQRLEAELDVRLFQREDHNLALTEAGRQLHQTARLLVSAWASLQDRLQPVAEHVQGVLRVGSSSIPVRHFLPRILPSFHRDHPAVKVVLESLDSGQTLDLLLKDEIDVAILGSRPDSVEIASERIATDRLVVVAAPEHAAPGAWQDGPFILREPGSGTRRAAEMALRDMGISADAVPVVLQTNDASLILRMVQEGLGLAVVSCLDAQEAVAAGRLRIVHEWTTDRPFYAACLRTHAGAPLVGAFLQTVRAQMGIMT